MQVLPSSLLTMCCAPMPFVVGILSSALPEVSRLPLDEVLMLDIDHNKFLLTPGTWRRERGREGKRGREREKKKKRKKKKKKKKGSRKPTRRLC